MAALFTEEAAAERACGSKELKERVGSASARSTCHAHAHITARGVKPCPRGQSLRPESTKWSECVTRRAEEMPLAEQTIISKRSQSDWRPKNQEGQTKQRSFCEGKAQLNCERDNHER